MKHKFLFVLGFIFGGILCEMVYLAGIGKGLRSERDRIVKWLKTEQCPECEPMVDRMIDHVEHKEHWKPLQ